MSEQVKNYRDAIGTHLKNGFHVERAFAVRMEDEGDESEESRIVELSFASNLPIRHYFGFLELDMSASSVRMERMNSGAALLCGHDPDDQIGVVQSVRLEKEKARATVKFSRSERGQENLRDVLDGIKQNVSVGFIPHTIEQKVDAKGKQVYEDGEPVYISRDWEPFEVSLVSIPADISVGVNRSIERIEETVNMSEPITQAANPPETTATVVVSEADRREEQFLAIGRRFNQETLAATYALDKNKTEDELRRAIAQAIQPVETIPVASAATIATRAGEQPRLATAVKRYGKLRNFTGEGSEEKAYRFGMWFLGSAIGIKSAQRWCNENGILTRTQNESVNEQGGFLVPEEFGTDLIDLREQYSVFRRNAKIVPMATDTRTDPRRTGGLTAYFTGESDDITKSNKTWDRVSLTAKKLSVLARMTSELSEDSAISIADDLAGEIAYAFGKKEDECGFVGTGSSTFGGIVGATEALKGLSGTIANIAGLKVGTGNAYSELTLNDFIGTVAKLPEFADMNAKWYVHKLFYHDVMVRAMLAAGGVTAAEIESARNKTFLGYPVEFTQVMPKVEANSQVCALFGDLAMAASMGVRRDTTIALSEHSRFANDEIEIRGTERFDINVHSVGNASATAADREAGALVGLITAAA